MLHMLLLLLLLRSYCLRRKAYRLHGVAPLRRTIRDFTTCLLTFAVTRQPASCMVSIQVILRQLNSCCAPDTNGCQTIHATSKRLDSTFTFNDVSLPAQHTCPHITR
jgi:hypothetical protein